MSWIDYRWAHAQLGARLDPDNEADRIVLSRPSDPPFYGVVMLAMRRADTFNLGRLRVAWPAVWDELQARYWTPFGLLESDPDGLKRKVMGEHYGRVELERESP